MRKVSLGSNRRLTGSCLSLVALLLITLAIPGSAGAASHLPEAGKAGDDRTVVLVLLDKITWQDISDADPSYLRSLAGKGAAGLLVNRTAIPETTSPRAYLTIGAGARADAGTAASKPMSPATFAALKSLNDSGLYRARVGYLGGALRKAGVAVAAFGNADALDSEGRRRFGREAGLVGLGQDGEPAGGDSSAIDFAGSGTDYAGLYRAVLRRMRIGGLIVIETGDSRRANLAGRSTDDAIVAADTFLRRVTGSLDLSKDLLIVATPSPPLDRFGKPVANVTPVMLVGKGISAGLATSSSTRRPGIVTLADITASITDFYGLSPGPRSTGRPVYGEPGDASFANLAEQTAVYRLNYRLAAPIIVAYGWVEGLLLIAGCLVVMYGDRLSGVFKRTLMFLLVWALSMSVAIFAAPLLPWSLGSAAGTVLAIVFLATALAGVAWRVGSGDASRTLLTVAGVATVFLTVDVLSGAPAANKSVLGYIVILAGRFYGIGNHQVSVLVPAAIISSAIWFERRDGDRGRYLPILAVFFAFIVFLIGYGGLGANTGGIIMAVPAFTWTYLTLSGRLRAVGKIVWASLFTAVVLAALALTDAFLSGQSSHLGVTTRRLITGGSSFLVRVVSRKALLGLAVFTFTYWSYLLIAVLVAALSWYLSAGRKPGSWLIWRHWASRAMIGGGMIAAVVGTVANDSGIAIMAVVLGYLLLTVLYLEIAERLALEREGETVTLSGSEGSAKDGD